jgi:hypothetical protein
LDHLQIGRQVEPWRDLRVVIDFPALTVHTADVQRAGLNSANEAS